MSRPRKLTLSQVRRAAADRRSGMTWYNLSRKYKCAINTLRNSLSKYSDEFVPASPELRSCLENRLKATEADLSKIKAVLKKRFNLHV